MVLILNSTYLKSLYNKLIQRLVNCIILFNVIICIYFFFQVLGFSTFKIPSDSMAPELIDGDNVLVFKPVLGARLFNVFAFLRMEQTDIWRIPGFRKVKRNDVLVFNFPHPNNWSKIEMDILKYYIKRCIALPGDSVFIHKGFYGVVGNNEELGNIGSQQKLSNKSQSEINKSIFRTFPSDIDLGWNIKEFGPLYIPKKGDKVAMNRLNATLYRKVIQWEQHGLIEIIGNSVFLDGKPIVSYEFKNNYYFMAGDKVLNSQDSRYWGLLPEEYIVGKAWIVWKSIDKYTGAFRWNRFLKEIK